MVVASVHVFADQPFVQFASLESQTGKGWAAVAQNIARSDSRFWRGIEAPCGDLTFLVNDLGRLFADADWVTSFGNGATKQDGGAAPHTA
jgi:hypothetical protein